MRSFSAKYIFPRGINIQTSLYMQAGMEIAIHSSQRHEHTCTLTHHLEMMHVMQAGTLPWHMSNSCAHMTSVIAFHLVQWKKWPIFVCLNMATVTTNMCRYVSFTSRRWHNVRKDESENWFLNKQGPFTLTEPIIGNLRWHYANLHQLPVLPAPWKA